MNSIAGIYRFDGRAVEAHLLEQMLMSMAHATAATPAIWCDGPVGLATVRVAELPRPALQQEARAVTVAGHRVVADARLDDRAGLGVKLGLEPAALRTATDEEMILAAYARWGAAAPLQLIGDYAFALWDAPQRMLFCARDHFGLRPFYYHQSAHLFAFASELRGLPALPEVPRDLDEVRIAFHLAVQIADKDSTFYQEIKRLPPAHGLQVSGRGASTPKRYWNLDTVPALPSMSGEAYADAFRERFVEAVRCRLPAAGPLGSLLSGGLDSTAVTCVARELLQSRPSRNTLHTYSAVFDQTPECDERPYIAETVALSGITPHFVPVEGQSPLANIDQMLTLVGEPFSSPTLYILWELYRTAGSQKAHVLLDGIDGDTAVHHGDAYLADLAQLGRWDEFFAQAMRLQAHGNYSVDRLMRRYGEPYLHSLASRIQWRSLQREVRAIAPYSDASPRRLFYYYGLRPLLRQARAGALRSLKRQTALTAQKPPLLSSRLWQTINLAGRANEFQPETTQRPTSAQQEHHRLLEAPLLTHIFEVSSAVSRGFGIDARHPFADRRLIEFCYALPAQYKLVDGWTRHIVRQGLAGLLPEAIRRRGGKTENSAAMTKAFQTHDAGRLDQLLSGHDDSLASYVDGPALEQVYRRYRASGSRQDEMHVWQAACLAIWLHNEDLTHRSPPADEVGRMRRETSLTVQPI